MLLSRGCHKWVVFGGSVNRITFRFAAARMLSGQYCVLCPSIRSSSGRIEGAYSKNRLWNHPGGKICVNGWFHNLSPFYCTEVFKSCGEN